uniref:Uncharacterized protein n=1 Tax=Setaria viridis TaxID=4556 RepID=A0A4U6VKS2_SETVI|nr:hypothetical protein SEVIR_2G025700v2 [Setaria viridis]
MSGSKRPSEQRCKARRRESRVDVAQLCHGGARQRPATSDERQQAASSATVQGGKLREGAGANRKQDRLMSHRLSRNKYCGLFALDIQKKRGENWVQDSTKK